MSRELLRQALEALTHIETCIHGHEEIRLGAINDLRAALSAPEPEPVAWMDDFGNAFPLGVSNGAGWWLDAHKKNWKPLYPHPSAPERKPMGNPEAVSIIQQAGFKTWGSMMFRIIRLTEAFHDIKENP